MLYHHELSIYTVLVAAVCRASHHVQAAQPVKQL
jgi:hypothetical protein